MQLFYLLPRIEKENLDPVQKLDYFQVLDAIKQFRIQLQNQICTPATDTGNCIKAYLGEYRRGKRRDRAPHWFRKSRILPSVELLGLNPCLEIPVPVLTNRKIMWKFRT
jgi:hypothetical protein